MCLQIAYLEELGIPSQLVCNMASMSPKILGQDVEQLRSVTAFLKEQRLNGTISPEAGLCSHARVVGTKCS